MKEVKRNRKKKSEEEEEREQNTKKKHQGINNNIRIMSNESLCRCNNDAIACKQQKTEWEKKGGREREGKMEKTIISE